MQVTTEWMRKWFQIFNKSYFDSGLPEPLLRVGRSRTRLGTLAYLRRREGRRVILYNYRLTLSNYYDQTERDFQNTLLHEMIHYAIAYTGLKDTSSHGVVFRGMMSALNRRGWNITISANKNLEAAQPKPNKPCLVLALAMTDGRHFLSVVNPRSAIAIEQRIKSLSDVRSHGWYASSDTFFQNFPHVRSLRGRMVSADVYNKWTSTMKPFQLPD